MMSVVVSRDRQTGKVTLEQTCVWSEPGELAQHQASLQEILDVLTRRYGGTRDVFTAAARNLRQFCLCYPEYAPDGVDVRP